MSSRRSVAGARVLAFADSRDSLVAACRLHAPLAALRHAGLIDEYVVTDATLRGAPRSGLFDVVWLQRGADAGLTRLLAARLPGRFLLDVDDHLLCRPGYLAQDDLPDAGALIDALAACRVLTAPSSRLAGLLEQRAGVALLSKTWTCPNAVTFGAGELRKPQRPVAVLLTQGHRLALTASEGDVLGAITEFAARRQLPLRCVGAQSPALRVAAASVGAELEVLAPRSYRRYHADLAAGPVLLGVAPLETRGDAQTNEFVSGKSDIKMVEYGGYGHPAVYSRAAPYVDTDLVCGRLADNDAASWTAALEGLCDDGWRALADEMRTVRVVRDLGSVARRAWWPALQAARLESPVDAAKLLSEVDRLRALARDAATRARWHLGRR